MKPEPCHLALKLLDADEPCGACGHLARTHRNHASYVDPDAKPAEPKTADEFDGWTPPMLRAAIAFERATIAELRLDLHRERERRQTLERGIVEILAATKNDTAREATLIRERDAARGEATALEELRPALAAARKELAELRFLHTNTYGERMTISIASTEPAKLRVEHVDTDPFEVDADTLPKPFEVGGFVAGVPATCIAHDEALAIHAAWKTLR